MIAGSREVVRIDNLASKVERTGDRDDKDRDRNRDRDRVNDRDRDRGFDGGPYLSCLLQRVLSSSFESGCFA